ncbi:hypothetical protein [Paracidovorax sp. MALMAid1276]|uniref:hypothetical protein n=1 Tax=Paracidovorax sp. MALMAid1276 TaxID=3411631 RepID=UPI003B9CB1FD
MTLMISKFRWLLSCSLVLVLAACAPLTVPPKEEFPAGRARLVLPPGTWQDLGSIDETVGGVPLQTRSVGLRGAQGEWMAVLRVQTNRGGALSGGAPWSGECPRARDVTVDDAAKESPVRADCLRFKRWASSGDWLLKNEPELARWASGQRISWSQPYSHLGYRYATDRGALVAVDALVDHRLLRPKTQNNEEFLTAGRPALAWSHALAEAARLSVGMVDGYLAVPPFPYAEAALARR